MFRLIREKIHNWPLYVSIVVISSLAIFSSIVIVGFYSDRIIQNHTYEEMQTLVETQSEIIEREIEEQITPLNMLAEYIKDSDTFQDEDGRAVLEALKKENCFCALGFADKEGNAVNYNGEAIGNISNRAYFSEVISGEKTEAVEYMPTTIKVAEPRFLFSVPVCENNEITGVIFASKEDAVISDVLLGDTLFDGSERIYITDSQYKVLAANKEGAREMNNKDLTAEFQYLRENSSTNQSSGGLLEEENVYVASIPVGINSWQMVCVLDKENAENIFEDITVSLRNVAKIVSALLLLVLFYTILMTHYRVTHYRKGEKRMFNQYSSYRTLLEKTRCAFVEYHVSRDTISANRFFMEQYANNDPVDVPITMQRLQELYPEFNFKELDEAIQLVEKTKKPYTFETAITFSDGKIYWIEITAMPQADLDGRVTDILAAVVDTTSVHEVNSDEVISNIPNGIHRCYLSNPIHMEFAGKGMCEMLDYTEEELYEKLGQGKKLSALVHPEDLKSFRDFVHEAAVEPGRYQCEYRMRKKDGEYISVLDVMEVKKAASGVLYGYSSVTDITELQKTKEEKHRQELEELEGRLRTAQLKNSMSQMQPHFLYNALASIREIVLDDPQYASDLIYDFSTHLRACIRAMSNNDMLPFEQELDNINAYINIEKMRFGDKLRTEFDIRDKDFDIVPLSIQPLVENAIRHGIYQRGAAGGTVTVSTELTEACHVIKVKDDGVGFDYALLQQEIAEKNRDSTGLTNLSFRLKKIMNAEITVDSTPGEGTVITVLVPRGREEN